MKSPKRQMQLELDYQRHKVIRRIRRRRKRLAEAALKSAEKWLNKRIRRPKYEGGKDDEDLQIILPTLSPLPDNTQWVWSEELGKKPFAGYTVDKDDFLKMEDAEGNRYDFVLPEGPVAYGVKNPMERHNRNAAIEKAMRERIAKDAVERSNLTPLFAGIMAGHAALPYAGTVMGTLGRGAATLLSNPWVDAGLTSYFGAEGLRDLANGKANWMTALEVAPLGRLAKPVYKGVIEPGMSLYNSPITGKWTKIGNREYRLNPNSFGASGVPLESRPHIGNVSRSSSTKGDTIDITSPEIEKAFDDYYKSLTQYKDKAATPSTINLEMPEIDFSNLSKYDLIEDDFVNYLSGQTGKTIKRVPIKDTKHGDIYTEGFSFVDENGKEIAHIAGNKKGNGVWVESSYMDPEYRGQGLGKQMYFDFNEDVFDKYGTTLHSSPYQRVGSVGAGMSPSNRLWKSLRDNQLSTIEGGGLNRYDVMAEPSKITTAYRTSATPQITVENAASITPEQWDKAFFNAISSRLKQPTIYGDLISGANHATRPDYMSSAMRNSYRNVYFGKAPETSLPLSIRPSDGQSAVGLVIQIPQSVKDIIYRDVVPRLQRYRDPSDVDRVVSRVLSEGYYHPNEQLWSILLDAGDQMRGYYSPYFDSIVIKPGERVESILPHEIRHKIDEALGLNGVEKRALENAFGRDFIESNKELGTIIDYDAAPEMVTTNGDFRRELLKLRMIDEYRLNPDALDLPQIPNDIALLNRWIDEATSKDIINALWESNGYGEKYAEFLENNRALIPERVKALKWAAKAVGGVAPFAMPAFNEDQSYRHGKDKHKIYIKPKNRGKFNALKKRTGKTTELLTHSKNPLTRKRAIFALNARKWVHKKK